jgi:hypothetical protein
MNKAARKRMADLAKSQQVRLRVPPPETPYNIGPGHALPALERVWPFGQTVIFEELSWYPPGVFEMVLKARDMLDMQPVPIRAVVPAHWKEPLLEELERERNGLGLEPMTDAELNEFLTRFVWMDRPLPSPTEFPDHAASTLAEGGDHQPELVAHLPIRTAPHQA